MPSPIAHSITGYCLARLWPGTDQAPASRLQRRVTLGATIFAANAADLDFLPKLVVNTDFHRGITHSIGLAVVLSLVTAGVVGWQAPRLRVSMFKVALLAYGSHLVMDLLTAGGRGMPVLWPLTATAMQSPVTVFPQVHHSEGLFYSGHLSVLAFELTYGVVLLGLVYGWQTGWGSRKRPPLGPQTSLPSVPSGTGPHDDHA